MSDDAYRINLELIVTHPVMHSIKDYDINVPEVCIAAILKEIERCETITGAVAVTTASKEVELQQLKAELRVMREKLEKMEAAAHKPRFWQK
jgi:flagellar motility protein MotE (MotC chaperone)